MAIVKSDDAPIGVSEVFDFVNVVESQLLIAEHPQEAKLASTWMGPTGFADIGRSSVVFAPPVAPPEKSDDE